MFSPSAPSAVLNSRSTPLPRFVRDEDDLAGTRLLREADTGCCGKSCIPSIFRQPVKTLMYLDKSGSVWWADNGRFVMHDVQSSDTMKTPRNRIRWNVRCITSGQIDGQEYVWTGHRGGEICVWTEHGQLLTKPLKASKSCIRVICMVGPGRAWVGGDSGNIRVVELDLSQSPAELTVKTTVVPGLAPVGRITANSQWKRPVPIKRPNFAENVPEETEISTSDPSRIISRSQNSFAAKVSSAVQTFTFHSRAHRSHVTCIFAKGGRVWTAGGRVWYLGTIKMWDERDKSLLGKFLCESRGACSCITWTPWVQANQNRSLSRDLENFDDWRLLTAHDSGKILLWDPGYKELQPLLEIEFRKSPIRSCVVFSSLGLLCTCHRDGTVEVSRLPTPQMRLPALSSSTPVTDEDQIYPFIPRTTSEYLHPSGLRFAVGGQECLFTVSNSGRVLYWPKEKLESTLKILRQSSISRIPMEVVNESVMVIDHSQLTLGETIWEGDFATVKKGKFLAKDVIVKEATERADSKKAMKALVKDAHILAALRHPNIVNIMAVGDSPPFVVMQFYEEGSLYDVLKRARNNPRYARRLTWEKRLGIAIGTACGMHFLHQQKIPILHRDLKTPNIFIERDFISGVVGDFNLSKDTPRQVQNIVSSARPTNPMWLAPEIVKGRSDFSVASDIYSFGIVMWELMSGRTPWDHLKSPGKRIMKEAFYGRIRYELYEGHRPRVRRDEAGRLLEIPSGKFPQGEQYVQLMEDCWADNPDDRPENFEIVIERLEAIKRGLVESKLSGGFSGRMTDGSRRASPIATPLPPPQAAGNFPAVYNERENQPPDPGVRPPLPPQEVEMAKRINRPPMVDSSDLPTDSDRETGYFSPSPLPPSPFDAAPFVNPPPIPASPFDMPECVDDQVDQGGNGQHQNQNENQDNSQREVRMVQPVPIPASPFDMPYDQDAINPE